MIQVDIRSDYAILETPKYTAYYGYEEIDPVTGDWCCVIKKNGKEVARIPNSLLTPHCEGGGPGEMLLVGLGMYLGK